MEIEDIETEITGQTIKVGEPFDGTFPPIHLPPSKDPYEEIKKAEVRHSWLQHEGTSVFLAKLDDLRAKKLAEAESLAKIGQTENAVRLLLQSCSIRETCEIIKNNN